MVRMAPEEIHTPREPYRVCPACEADSTLCGICHGTGIVTPAVRLEYGQRQREQAARAAVIESRKP